MKLGELQQLTQNIPDLQGEALQQWMQNRLRSMGLDPNALYQELEMTSHFADTHQDTSYSNANMQLHSHTFYEILYCCNTCGAEYLIGSERYRLQEGDVVFVPPSVSHRPLLPENMSTPYTRCVLWLSPEFMALYAGFFSHPFQETRAYPSLLRTAGTKWEYLGNLFRSGVQETQKLSEGWEAAVIGNAIQILTQIRRATTEQSVHTLKAEKPMLLDQLMAYIEEHYTTRFTIDDMAKHCFVSSSTISHLFKEKLGVSLYRYVTQRRLIAAKQLIENGSPLDDVSLQTGFQDYSSFYRAFKQEYGISPRQYRNLQ